jgi:hypothetical protein
MRMEDVIRTVNVKLDVPTERCDDLHQTKTQFLLPTSRIGGRNTSSSARSASTT